MSTPVHESGEQKYIPRDRNGSGDTTVSSEPSSSNRPDDPMRSSQFIMNHPDDLPPASSSKSREEAHRLEDDLAVLEVERQISQSQKSEGVDADGTPLARVVTRHSSRARAREPEDEFDTATRALHEQTSKYKPPENPSTGFARFFKKVHESSFLVRYFTYITPIVLILLIPLLVGALAFPDAHVGGVQLTWFAIWLEIVWLTLWAGRLAAKCIPGPVFIIASLFTNNAKKWRDLARQLELPAALFFWWLGIEISFLPTMTNHHIRGPPGTKHWEVVVNKIIISIFVGTTLNLIEKLIIQLIAISFHLRTYADRIEINTFQIGSLAKLYAHSKQQIAEDDDYFVEKSGETTRSSGGRTPLQYAHQAQKAAKDTLTKITDVAGVVAGDFTGRKVVKSNHPHQVVITLLSTTSGSQVLARRLYRTFAREGFDTVFPGDLKSAFENGEEAEAAFAMFDKDMNGDISMEELEAVCVEIGRERKSIMASLKDLDSVVSKLDDVFFFIVLVITVLVFLSLISTSTAGVLTSAGSTLLALSWLFSATAQELLASIIFVFVKHPFDVGDRVSIYGNTGKNLTGDDYYVKEIALLYTEFKKMEGHVVQAPNSYLNTLFILNQRRSGALAEAVPIIIKYGTTIEQIDALRQRLVDFVQSEKREYGNKILTELREVVENFSITLNVVFFYKSNWQNELLRLQRRNKFICNLMLCLQELNIQGPRHNLAGYNQDAPYHVSYPGPPPRYSASSDDPSNPRPSQPSDGEARDRVGSLGASTGHQPTSILRNRAGTTSSTRSIDGAGTRKHVDFSLGMQDISSSDMVSDVYEDRKSSGVRDVVRTANREYAERRRQERLEQVEEEQRSSADHSRGRRSIDSHHSGDGSIRPVASGHDGSIASSSRFFRLRSAPSNASASASPARRPGDVELMEQGRLWRDISPVPPPPPSRTVAHSPPDPVPAMWSSEQAGPSTAQPGPNRPYQGDPVEMHTYPRHP